MTIIADHEPVTPARLAELLHKAGYSYTSLQDDERDILLSVLPDEDRPTALIPLTELETLAVSESITAPADMCRRKVLNDLAHRLTHPAETPSGLAAFAAYVYEHQQLPGGNMLRGALLTFLVAEQHKMSTANILELVHDGYDDRIDDAGREADKLIEQARRQAQAAEYEPQPTVIAEQAVAA